MILRAAMQVGADLLRQAGIEGAARDARWLMADMLSVDPAGLLLREDDLLVESLKSEFDARIAARSAGQPVSKIIGKREFFGHLFSISRDTLDPRPETETLVQLALDALPVQKQQPKVLDLGTGSGCILLSILAARPNACGIGTDISANALKVAAQNAQRIGLGAKAQFVEANWWPAETGFDLIVSNPPYISESEMSDLSREVRDWDPQIALTPGGDGLDAYRTIASGLPAVAKPKAPIILEVGHRQAKDVSEILAHIGCREITVHRDLNGHDRVVSARIPSK